MKSQTIPDRIGRSVYLKRSIYEEIEQLCERHNQSRNRIIEELITHSLAIYHQSKPTEGRTLKHTLEETSRNG